MTISKKLKTIILSSIFSLSSYSIVNNNCIKEHIDSLDESVAKNILELLLINAPSEDLFFLQNLNPENISNRDIKKIQKIIFKSVDIVNANDPFPVD